MRGPFIRWLSRWWRGGPLRRLAPSGPSRGNWGADLWPSGSPARRVWALIAALIGLALLLPPVALPWRALGLLRGGPDTPALDPSGPASLTLLDAEQSAALRGAPPPGVSLAGGPYALTAPEGEGPLEITLPLPDGRSAEHLEAYAWDGQGWRFVPARKAGGGLIARLSGRPQALALFEREEEPLSLWATQDPGEAGTPEGAGLAGLWVNAFLAGPDGGVRESGAAAPAAGVPLWPMVSVTDADRAGRLVGEPEVREAHLASLLGLAGREGYAGLVLDYRPAPEDAAAYASFVAALAESLHQQGRALAIRAPQGMDPAPLGLLADAVLIGATGEGPPSAGALEEAIGAVLGSVQRSKLLLALDARSVEVRDGRIGHLGYLEALEGLTAATLGSQGGQITAGERVSFALSGAAPDAFDEQAQAFLLKGSERTIYLTDAYALLRRAGLARDHRLGGIVVRHALAPGADPRLWEVLQAGSASPRRLQLAYRVGDGSLNLLRSPSASFRAPEEPGRYRLVTGLTGDGGRTFLASHETAFEVVPAYHTYVVQSGDTLYGIALEFGVTVDAIRAANGLEGSTILIGQELRIPARGGSVTPAGSQATATPEPTPAATAEATATPSGAATPTPTATPKPAAPPPGSTASTSFGYGIQVHMYYQDHGAIINNLKALGVGWVRHQIRWRDVEVARGAYDWGEMDRFVNALHGNGLKILFSVATAPDWARPGGANLSVNGPPADLNDYANFVRTLAARYKGKVQMYEIWNEQNLHDEWGGKGGKINARQYVQLLAAAYSAIKAVDPSIVVLSGAPTPTGFNDGDTAVDDLVYLEQMYQAGLKQYSDAIAVHPSGYNNPADAQACCWSDPSASFGAKGHRSWFFRDTMEQYRAVMAKHADGGKKLVPTEFGWASTDGLGVGPTPGYEYAADNTEAEQAAFIVKAFQMGQNWGWVGPMFLWNLNFGPVSGANDEKAKFGILRPDWSQRPAFAQLTALTPN